MIISELTQHQLGVAERRNQLQRALMPPTLVNWTENIGHVRVRFVRKLLPIGCGAGAPAVALRARNTLGCVRPLFLFYWYASANEVEERSLVPHSRSHARLWRNATMSHACVLLTFSCVHQAFTDL
ncbi:hypothetical protein EVAR_17985_1 [Eumeta japonica]|uniref:Uncharacterized protein n=1 Tax=Eumeta variegata TaxID=151549 RepID=A0A4C1Y8L3_EUMVA|nr:hypothetical protein EVAR_17985_1 [Eumeta japonica]